MKPWETTTYRINHIGWLLASDAPENISKGERLLAVAPAAIQRAAERRRDELLQQYATARGGNK